VKLFWRKADSRPAAKDEEQPTRPAVIDLTAADGFAIDVVSETLSKRNSDLDALEQRLESVRKRAAQLSDIDLSNRRRGEIHTLDLSDFTVGAEDEEFDEWFDEAFSDDGQDELARKWFGQS